jgi:hypothetical protein
MNLNSDQGVPMAKSDPIRAAREELMSAGLVEHPGVGDVVPEVIERSWRRSISHRVATDRVADQAGEVDPETVLYRAALPVLERWERHLADTPMTLLLSDRAGRIVARRLGERDLRSRLDLVNAAEGFDFSEETMGTNGLGTSLAERRPVLISGSQHYNDLLSSLTCAAAPVVAPGGSVVGSVSLGGPVKYTSALMLSLTQEIGQQIEQRLRAQTRPEDLALALSFIRYKNSLRPTVVVDRQTLMANMPGLPFVSVDTHIVLWELLVGHDWRRSDTLEFTLPSGAIISGRPIGDTAEPRYVVHFFDPRAQHNAPPTSAVSSAVTIAAPTPGRDAVILVDGPGGSGRLTLARDMLAVRPGADPVVVIAGSLDWAVLAAGHLALGSDVVVRRLETLDANDAAAFEHLLLDHASAVDRGERTSTLALTASSTRATAPVRAVLDRVGARQVVAPLAISRERIPTLVRDLLVELDADSRHSLAPTALQALLQHHWPGEVRELRMTLSALLATDPPSVIERKHLPPHLRTPAPHRQLALMEAAERDAIIRALEIAAGNKSAAAELLGIGRTTLYRRMRQLQVEVDEDSL